jgi:hypothetical protein
VTDRGYKKTGKKGILPFAGLFRKGLDKTLLSCQSRGRGFSQLNSFQQKFFCMTDADSTPDVMPNAPPATTYIKAVHEIRSNIKK